MGKPRAKASPWLFVPSQYFIQAVPYVAVTTLSVVIYTQLGVAVETIGLVTSLISLPWVIKPLWSPLVDWIGTRRAWHIWCTAALAGCFLLLAFAFQQADSFSWSIWTFVVCGFISATYDIATDGYYLHALDTSQQAFFSGIRSTTWRLGFMFTNGLLVMAAGYLIVNDIQRSHGSAFDQAKELVADVQTIEPSEVDQLLMQDPANAKKAAGGNAAKRAHILRLALVKQVVSIANDAQWTIDLARKTPAQLDEFLAQETKKRIKAARRSKKDTSSIEQDTRREFAERIQQDRVELAERRLAQSDAFLSVQRKSTSQAWSKVLGAVALLLLAMGAYHLWVLPFPASDLAVSGSAKNFAESWQIFASFFRQPSIAIIVAFILLYRFGEAFLLRMASVFLLRELGMTATEYALGYSIIGLLGLISGGLIGGWVISRYGLKRTIWPLALAMNIPDLLYVYMAVAKPPVAVVYAMIGLEQLGFGLGFTAFMVFLMYTSKGPYRTAHYAIATGLMALAMMAAGMISGYLIAGFGYVTFFIIVTLCTIPGMALIPFLPIEEEPREST